jgi:thiamine biosynthesis lipoprotein
MKTNQSKRFQIVLFLITCLFVVIAWYATWKKQTQPVVEQRLLFGRTMGTRYSVRFFGAISPDELEALYVQLETELARVNHSMSTYRPDSEITAFNRAKTTNAIAISDSFQQVLTEAQRVARETGGAFDPTVARLVNLWGFGPEGRITNAPGDAQIRQAQQACGWQHIELKQNSIIKHRPDLQLDLGGIAKGYGVDRLAALLTEDGFTNYVVEIGGETRASGRKPDGSLWRIGIQKPHYLATPGDKLVGIATVTDRSIATSGDYQNFFTDGTGTIYSHIIDPRTGRPAGHTTAGVTVVAESCATADAFATALYVMGPEEGLAFVEKNPDLEALFVVRMPNQKFRRVASSGFDRITGFSAHAQSNE